MEVAGVRIDSLKRHEALSKASTALQQAPVRVFFVNAHSVNVAQSHENYRKALKEAELVLNDGAGVEVAGRWLGSPFHENLNGTDWIPGFFAHLSDQASPCRVYLLGGNAGVSEKAKSFIEREWPQLEVAGGAHGFFEDQGAVLQAIEQSSPDILLVGMGVPKQELFIAENWARLKQAGVRVAIGGGAILDFLSGEISRAPLWMRRARLEWLYRFWREPRRLWRRYLVGNLRFLVLVLKDWWRRKRRSSSGKARRGHDGNH